MTVLVNPPAEKLGFENAILTGTSTRYRVVEFPGPLSIKSIRRGSAVWETRRARHEVRRGAFLVLNDGRPYSLTIDSPEPVETFCVFFRRGLVEEARRSLTLPESALLDRPGEEPREPAGFAEAVRRDAPSLLAGLERLYAETTAVRYPSPLALDERVYQLGAALLLAQTDAARRMARLPARRPSTREELYRRLERARELIASDLAGDLTLDRLARAACLSPYHFHRAFTQTYRETPHRYVTRLRLERARRLLERSDAPVTAICRESGFESLGSFATLFRRRFGLSPRPFRAARKSKSGEVIRAKGPVESP